MSPSGQPPCPADSSVCTFAVTLDQHLRSGNVAAVAQSLKLEEFECPGPTPRGAGDAFPLCAGSQPGEKRQGHLMARLQSEGEVHSPATYEEVLRRWLGNIQSGASDQTGPGSLRLATIGCPQSITGAACKEQFSVTFTALLGGGGAGAQPHREVLMFYGEQAAAGDNPRIAMTVYGLADPQDPVTTAVRGGTAQLPGPRHFAPFGVFTPWTPGGQR